MQHKIVVRFLDGRVLKGSTNDFLPTKELFHLIPMDAKPGAQPLTVSVRDCKAVFFVKDYTGNSQYQDRKDFEPNKAVVGKKLQVLFKDSETLVGSTQGYQPGRPGFFLFPADPKSNIDRCFIVSAATQTVTFL